MIDLPKNQRETLRLELTEYRGKSLANVRVWFEADDGELRPSAKGVTFRAAMLPDVHEALGQLVDEAREAGLLESEVTA